MALMTIGQVSEMLGVSARMLRYYEKEGLVRSMHRENYAYRVYDEDAVRRIRQIVLLRRLQMPLKRIRVIMDGSAREAAGMVQEQIADMERNLASDGTIRTALERLRELLGEADSPADRAWERVLGDMAGLLALERYKLNGSALCPVSEKEKQIRIVLLPPCAVASFRYFGENPEEKVGSVMDRFIRGEGLYEKKPDSRLFGFNPADGEGDDRSYSYENWVTIPEDLVVPAPLAKKRFAGGLYAAYAIRFPDFQEWDFLKSWAKNNDRYRARPGRTGRVIRRAAWRSITTGCTRPMRAGPGRESTGAWTCSCPYSQSDEVILRRDAPVRLPIPGPCFSHKLGPGREGRDGFAPGFGGPGAVRAWGGGQGFALPN